MQNKSLKTFRKKRIISFMMIVGVTVVILMVFIGIVSAKKSIHSNYSNAEKELIMVHIVMRHGIRTPADTFPTDPHINDTFYPTGWGQITNEGKEQLYETGIYLRQRYNKFLSDYYSPNEYYAQSTDVDRTRTSVQLINAGLWPPKLEQKWSSQLEWQPIPVHAEPLDQDQLLLVRKPCAAYHIERDKVMKSEEIENKLEKYKELFQDLTFFTGKTIKDFDDVQDIYSTLRAEDLYNLTLPEWTKLYYPEKLNEPTIFSYIVNSWNDKMNRFKGGVFLKKIITDWQTKIDNTISPKERKTFFYCGHDSTIVNLLRTLKIWDAQMPDYGITVLLELLKDLTTGIYGIEIYLRNSTFQVPVKLTLPGCNTFCPLEQLIVLTKNVIPINWQKECNADGSYDIPEPGGP